MARGTWVPPRAETRRGGVCFPLLLLLPLTLPLIMLLLLLLQGVVLGLWLEVELGKREELPAPHSATTVAL